jgi:hypothetical protein
MSSPFADQGVREQMLEMAGVIPSQPGQKRPRGRPREAASVRTMAKIFGRSKSTIARDLQRVRAKENGLPPAAQPTRFEKLVAAFNRASVDDRRKFIGALIEGGWV